MIEFIEKGIVWQVRLMSNGQCAYRDKAHLGGPWTYVAVTLGNTSIRVAFRRALAKACQQIKE